MIIYSNAYTLYSVVVLLREFKNNKELSSKVKTLYVAHILNAIVFNASWIPS